METVVFGDNGEKKGSGFKEKKCEVHLSLRIKKKC